MKGIKLYRLIANSRLFDHTYLREQRPDLPKSRSRCTWAYLRDPQLWSLHPHPLFDGVGYMERSPDLLERGVNPLAHYLGWGHAENRVPNSFFDSAYYIAQVTEGLGGLSPLEHYVRYGAQRGLRPCAHFDYELYRELVDPKVCNADVFADLSRYRNEPSRQAYVSAVIERALRTYPRAAVRGSLTPGDEEGGISSERRNRCDVVIPVKNAIDWCERCYRSLMLSDALDEIGSVVFVDDGCTPVARQLLEQCVSGDPRVKIVTVERNHGFAAACNTGFHHTQAAHVLFLNSDCLLNARAIGKMLRAFQHDSAIGLSCAPANNAANVTLPLPEGESFVSVDALLDQLHEKRVPTYPDICTTVGHCLMVSRECYLAVGGMDESWGLGYGEESDLHLRARSIGYRGVVVPDAYVYHFGGGTFRNESNREELQQRNYQRFMTLWGDSFAAYHRLASLYEPLEEVQRSLHNLIAARSEESCDVLFVLPGISGGVGGIHVALDLCNHLVQNGVDAKLVVMGVFSRDALKQYPEPLYANPLHVENEDELVGALELKPKVVVSTLFSTVPACWKLAQKHGAALVNFVQGYEPYFQDGVHYESATNSYLVSDYSITTSDWLWHKVVRKAPGKDVRQLPIGVNTRLFFAERQAAKISSKIRVGLVLRSAHDKGQFVLRELIDLMLQDREKLALTVFKPAGLSLGSPWQQDLDTVLVDLPTGRDTLANNLREVDIFIDASLHEGFGLFPLEAMACGAAVIASNSGGVLHYLKDGENGVVVHEVNQPEAYLRALRMLVANPSMLSRLKINAQSTALLFDESQCFNLYLKFFNKLLRAEPGNDIGKRSDSGQPKEYAAMLPQHPTRGSFGEAAVRADVGVGYQQIAALLEQKAADICDLHLQVQKLTHTYQVAAQDLRRQEENYRTLEQDLGVRIIRKIRSLITVRRNGAASDSPIN